MTRVPARFLMAPGFLVASIGMLILTQIGLDSSYPVHILPGLILMGLGMGTAFMPAMSLATHGVQPRDAGVASAMVNTSQQVGGAIGTALLNTIAASATTTWLTSHRTAAAATNPAAAKVLQFQGMVHGFSTAIWVSFGILAAAATVAFTFVNAGRPGAAAGSTAGAQEGNEVPVLVH
jgi:hypothetical protein